jgi:fibronectin type III domain protein
MKSLLQKTSSLWRAHRFIKSSVSKFITLVIVVTSTGTLTIAQTVYTPARYWTFNGVDATRDSVSSNNLNFTTYNSAYTVVNSGLVGKHITLDGQSNLVDAGSLTLSNQLTVEFLFKPGYTFNTSNIMSRGDAAFNIRIEYPKILFTTNHKSGSGSNINDVLTVDLNGIGRKSFGYYTDDNWHHMVFKINTSTGAKEIWVDGEMPSGFSKTVSTGTFANSGNTSIFINHTVNYVRYHGALDEVALYTSDIPDELIYKHYTEAQSGLPYSFTDDYSQTLPSPSPISGPIDVDEFAPGHPSVSVTAVEQLTTFPTPRYKPGHTLLPNFNWMDPRYMGGLFQPGITNQMSVNNSVIIQTELAKKYNYYFNVDFGTDPWDLAWVNTANANPDFKLAIITFRAQINGNNPELKKQNKTASHYLQNASGTFIDASGNPTGNKIWRPTAPTSSYQADGAYFKSLFADLFTRLNKPIDIVNENGEIFPHSNSTALSRDPVVTNAKNASGLDWDTYYAKSFQENEIQSFRDVFMNSHAMLSNATFTEYAIDGQPDWRIKYSEARKVNHQINGQYYSTPDFYPRWPDNWRYWNTAWHGWQWIVESRYNELAVGDRLYSPFVAAGWDVNPESNIRPGQWLGLLKCLNMTGAEFFYTGFFSLSSPWPDSKNWIWQAVMPSYAQAVTSRYEDLLRNGYLMDGDIGNSFINPTAPGYAFWSGDLRNLVVVRKHNSQQKYAITGTVQPNSNMTGNAELESTATITLDGQSLSFKIRRQGSVYIYDNTNASEPVFYQIDKWHERVHPSRWTNDFNFEGELFDNTNTQVTIKTEVPAGTASGDFTNFTSYISWPDNVTTPLPVEYNFEPRNSSSNTYYLWVKARSRGGVTTSMNVQLDNGTAQTIGCITDTVWTWYRYDACNQQAIEYQNISTDNHNIIITPENKNLEIDEIILTSDAGLILNNAAPSCGTAVATVTPNGSTSFCQGGDVDLTASSGTSYLWSPGGATTQTITVNAAGNYTVTVGTGTGCSSVSTPIQITVNQATTPTVTPSGTTTINTGQTVTLSSSTAVSYLWTSGESTQSITVSTAGNYAVTITDVNGCTATSLATTVTVNQTQPPVVTINTNGDAKICPGESVTLTATAGTSYLWQPGGQTTQAITVTNEGTYTVDVTDATGTGSASLFITQMPAPNAPTIQTSYIPNSAYQLTAYEPAAHSYIWSTGQTSGSINVNSGGVYSVVAVNSKGCSSGSQSMTVSQPAVQSCLRPNMLSEYDITDTKATFSWNPGIIADTFRVEYNITGSSTIFSQNVPGNVSSLNVTGLNSGATYKWTVISICNGNQQTANGRQFTTMSGPLFCGSTPQDLQTFMYNSMFVKISWYNTTASKFVVRYRPVGTSTWKLRRFFNSSTQGILQGLTPGTTYEWQVRAHCNSQISLYSKSAYFTTTTACPSLGLINVIDLAFNKVLISWNQSITVDTIRIRYAPVGTTNYRIKKISGNPNPGLIWIYGLSASTTYNIWVSTVCSDGGWSLWGVPATFTTQDPPTPRFAPESGIIHLNAYPNPTRDRLSYVFESDDFEDYIVKVCDMSGRELISESRFANTGLTGDHLSLIGMPSGLYMLIIQKGALSGRFKFNIQQ